MKYDKKIKSRICIIANRLKKMGLTLSAAFKKAWELIKGNTIESKVAGVTKGNRQKALHRIFTHYKPKQVRVWLERDKANLHDNNAVAVIISVNGSVAYKIGYIPSNLAYVISAIVDKGIKLKTTFKEVIGHYTKYMNYGAVITLQLS